MTRCAVCMKPFKTKTDAKGNVAVNDPSMVVFFDGERAKSMYRHVDCKQSDFVTKRMAEEAAAAKEVVQ